ncbi:hypothetical protein [Saccharomonospora saliphila]|uniref:hypothetical protein n=1 Tax=Saccharomonospora saliphila TaxID=369829 RepID=UPI000365A08A|nr:hypothetical protein [Saccharomonospora saliphila]
MVSDERPRTLGGRTDPTSTHLRMLAAAQRRRFEGRAMRVGRSDIVHAVRLRRWVGDEEVPAPACRVGTDTPDVSDELRPVTDRPVTCRRCLAYGIAREEGQPYQPRLAQIGLWADEHELELPRWPPAS